MKPRNLVFVALLWIGLVLPPMTLAGSLTAKEILTTFNVVITGTFTSQADVEGRLVAGTIFQPNGSPGFYNKPSPIANNSTNFQQINALNITCGSVTHCKANNGASVNNEVIRNFQNAATLHLFNWHGSVLAGMANITGTGAPLEGLLYGASYTGVSGGAELHDFPYIGQIPQEEAEIPEPSTWTMLTLGLAGLVLLGRRRALCKSAVLP